MSRDGGWRRAAPVVAGAAGLALIAFGAQGLPDARDINETAQKTADEVEQRLKDAQARKNISPEERGDEIVGVLRDVQEDLMNEGKRVNFRSLLAQPASDEAPASDWTARVRQAVYEARSDHRDPRTVLTGRVAFYAGLVLMFAAAVVLYRRTPQSVYKS